MTQITFEKKGITDIPADCIVNAANEGLHQGSGVCGAVFAAAGEDELTEACRKIGHCNTGSAVITPAFRLNAKYIIHAVGPVYNDGKHGEPARLYGCYYRSLELAREHGCRSIVFPVISTGVFGYPKEPAWRKALQACLDFGRKNPAYDLTVTFAVPNPNMLQLGRDTLAKLQAEAPDAGQELSPRERRAAVFQDTLALIESEPALKNQVSVSCQFSSVYFEDDYPVFREKRIDQIITVSQDRSFQAARTLRKQYPDGKIAVMNFANAFHPGGGVVTGSSAQEESLCRCSTLYPVLESQPDYYSFHKNKGDPRASDALIYSPGIVVLKSDTDFPERLPEEDRFMVDVITIAAPDLRASSNPHAPLTGSGTAMSDAELFGCHVRRAIHLLTVAASRGVDVLVLGAFGCGAFENDPRIVAAAYRTALQVFPKVFRQMEFAIYSKGNTNYEVFQRVFSRS